MEGCIKEHTGIIRFDTLIRYSDELELKDVARQSWRSEGQAAGCSDGLWTLSP
jgi:hypothetical protein